MKQFTPEQKHSILLEYTPYSPTHSFSALAARHGVVGGWHTISRWHSRWNRTVASLQPMKKTGRPRALTAAEVRRHIRAPIQKANRSYTAIHYSQLQPQVQQKTGKQVSLRTIQRYGKEELNAKQIRGKKRTANECQSSTVHNTTANSLLLCPHFLLCWLAQCMFSVSASMCEEIAKFRRKLQRIGTNRILFLDETHKRVGDAACSTIVLPHEPSFIESDETAKYSPRFDMIACCTSNEVFPPMIYAPNERGKGVNTELFMQYIRNLLAQAAGAIDRYPLYLVVDRATIHNEEKMLQEFHDWGCQELKYILKMPTASAKRLSPLDNSLFHVWQQRVLDGPPLTKRNIQQRMSDAWNTINKEDLLQQYRHCGLMRGQDPYFDCPNPALHRHDR